MIETTGIVCSMAPEMEIECIFSSELSRGESISVDGVCLTVVTVTEKTFKTHMNRETFSRTISKSYSKGSKVNLERAVFPGSRLGGHLVSGHVDSTGLVERIRKFRKEIVFWIKFPVTEKKWVIEKGSIAVNGISLTIAELSGNSISVSLIPETLKNTNARNWRPGSVVNLEYDMIGKYVVRQLELKERTDWLKENF